MLFTLVTKKNIPEHCQAIYKNMNICVMPIGIISFILNIKVKQNIVAAKDARNIALAESTSWTHYV